MSGFRRMMSYLWLVDDDDYEDYSPHEEQQQPTPVRAVRQPAPAAEAEPTSGIRTLPREASEPAPAVAMTPRSSIVRPIIPPVSTKPQTVTPTSFADAQEIGDRLKAGVSVIVNLQSADRDLMRRIIDFASGLTYGVGGEMERTADRVYLLTPTPRG